MLKARTRCYSIEIKNAVGLCLFSMKAYWTEKGALRFDRSYA
jgi:hypothetical protein